MNLLETDVKPILANQWVLGILTVVLFLYSSMAQQTLPSFMYTAFQNPFFNFVFFIAIVLVATAADFRSAFVVALLYMLLQYQFTQKKITEHFYDSLRSEGFAGDGYEDHATY